VKCIALMAAAVLAVGCAVPDSQKAKFTLENKTKEPVIIKASAGSFSQSIVLPPGGTWDGWIWAPLLIKDKAVIVIQPMPTPK